LHLAVILQYAFIVMVINRPQNKALYLFAYIFALAAIFLTPWISFLGYHLPDKEIALHWRTTWVGFDAIIALLLAATAISALRNYTWFTSIAPATATALLCDAWFDILTAHRASEFHLALITALLGEIPLAIICIAGTVVTYKHRHKHRLDKNIAG